MMNGEIRITRLTLFSKFNADDSDLSEDGEDDGEEDEDDDATQVDGEESNGEEEEDDSASFRKKRKKKFRRDESGIQDDESDEDGEEDDDEDDVEDGEEDDVEGDRDEDEDEGSPRHRKRKTPKRHAEMDLADRALKRLRANERRKKLQEEAAIIDEYYQSGTFYGMAVSNMIYNLASQLGRSSNDFLW